MRPGRAALVGALTVVAWQSPAFAQVKADVPGVVRIACASGDQTKDRDLSIESLSEAILVQSGYPLGNLVALGRTQTGDAYRDAVVNLVLAQQGKTDPFSATVGRNVLQISQSLSAQSTVTAKDLGFRMLQGPTPPSDTSDRYWFMRAAASTKFQCVGGNSTKGIIELVTAPTKIPRVGVVKTVEDLAKADQRAAADSAVIGVKVAKTTDDDGSSKKTTTLTFDGTVGLRVTPDDSPLPAFIYANYTLSKARVKPAPPLDPGKRRDDKDTNGLGVGATIGDIPLPLGFSLSATGSYVFDFVKDSERGVVSSTLTPGFNAVDAGFCGLGYLKTISLGKVNFRTRCILAGQLDYSHVFKVGRADFEDRGNFVSLGPVLGLDVLAPLSESTGVVGNVRYRLLPTVSGVAPTVHRLDLSLKYRWWIADGFGVDFGGTYKRGEELKTYTNENEFLLTFGVVR